MHVLLYQNTDDNRNLSFSLYAYLFELAAFLVRSEHGFVHSVIFVHSTAHSWRSDVGCDEISWGLSKIQSQGVPGNACLILGGNYTSQQSTCNQIPENATNTMA